MSLTPARARGLATSPALNLDQGVAVWTDGLSHATTAALLSRKNPT